MSAFMIEDLSRLSRQCTQKIHGTCIFPYIYHKESTIHVGKCTIPMDPIGVDIAVTSMKRLR